MLTGPGDTNAPSKVTGSINAFNAYMISAQTYLQSIAQNSASLKDGTYIWTVTFDGATMTILATPQTDGSIEWSVVFDGKTSDGTQYDNWTAVKGVVSKDGNTQEWYIYQPNSTQASVKMTMHKDEQGNILSTLEYPQTGDKQELINNKDGSGRYTEYISGVKRYEAIWNASGSGTYKVWDANGQLTNEGSW